MFQVEQGVSIPDSTKKAGRKRIYPIREMEPWDSFFVPLNGRESRKVVASILGSARAARYPDRKYSVRTQTEDFVEGIRVWRVK